MHVIRSLALCSVACVLTSASIAAADDKAACIEASEAGQSHRDAKKLEDARKSFLSCSREACPKVVRESCEGWLAEVVKAQPTLVFVAQDRDGKDILDVKVLVDGKQVLASLTGQAMPIDPGPRKISFVHPKLGTVDVTVLVLEAEKGRAITGEFGKPKSGAAPATKPTASAEPAAVPPEKKKSESSVSLQDAGGSNLPYVVGGAGAVALLASGYFYLTYSGKKSSLASACRSDGICPASEQGNIDGANQAGTLAVVTGLLGVAGVGVGTWLYLSEKEAKTKASFGVTPSGTPFATVSGRF